MTAAARMVQARAVAARALLTRQATSERPPPSSSPRRPTPSTRWRPSTVTKSSRAPQATSSCFVNLRRHSCWESATHARQPRARARALAARRARCARRRPMCTTRSRHQSGRQKCARHHSTLASSLSCLRSSRQRTVRLSTPPASRRAASTQSACPRATASRVGSMMTWMMTSRVGRHSAVVAAGGGGKLTVIRTR